MCQLKDVERLESDLERYDIFHALLSYTKPTSKAAMKAWERAVEENTGMLTELAEELEVVSDVPREGSILVRDRVVTAIARLKPDWDPTLPCACPLGEKIEDGVCQTCGRVIGGCGS